jgi:RNA polymerase sigma-70 factor (ECF subfamily)
MSQPASLINLDEFRAQASALRPQLHRYCARLTGSVFDGEDVVQDTFAQALEALATLKEPSQLRPWLFRIAHNRALDQLKSAVARREKLTQLSPPSEEEADPLDEMLREEVVKVAVQRFVELPLPQRSVVVLKDVLGQSLEEIAQLLGLSVDSIKAHLRRARLRLAELAAVAPSTPSRARPSEQIQRYVALFNACNWDGLRALLADDVKLTQSAMPVRRGAADVGMFFSNYERIKVARVVPARLEGREVVAVFTDPADRRPRYVMYLEWRDGELVHIRDYRYVSYVVDEVELELDE